MGQTRKATTKGGASKAPPGSGKRPVSSRPWWLVGGVGGVAALVAAMAAALFASWSLSSSSSGPAAQQQQLPYPADLRIDADALEYPVVASAKAEVLAAWGARARALAAATATAAAAAAPPPGVGAIAAQHEEWCRALSVLAVGLLLQAKSAGAAESTWRHSAGHGCADGAYNLAQFWRNTPARRSAQNEMSAMYRRSNALARPAERNATSAVRRPNMAQASVVSLRFAADQLEHLLRTGAALPPPPPGHSYASQVVAYRDIIARIPDDDPEGFQLTLAPADAARVPSYRTALYIEDKPRTDHHQHRHGSSSPADSAGDPAGALPPPPHAVAAMAPRSAADIAEVQRAYREESVVHLDGVLTPAALQALWEFSSRSTIYYEDKPRYGTPRA